MTNVYPIVAASCAAALAFTPLATAAEGWSTDMPSALEQAQSQDKDLLIDFTGSDWCGGCIMLDQEVFSQPAFQDQAPEHFVLVKLDFPENKPQSDEIKAQNGEWAQRLGVRGFPTIALVDSTGVPYAMMTGYQQGGVDVYMEHLDELRQRRIDRDEMMAAAEQAEGLDKAKHLDAALEAVGMELASAHYIDTVEQIVELDPANEAGLNEKYASVLNAGLLNTEMEAVMAMLQSGQADQAITRVDELIEEFAPSAEVLMQMRLMQAQVRAMQGQSDAALAFFDQAIEVAPDPEMAQQLQSIRSQMQMQMQGG